MLKLAIDIGGTFTDVVAETTEGLSSTKVLTSSNAPEAAALAGIAELLDRLSVELSDVDSVVHGTTLATNALIERRGAKTAFITTYGFRDVLEMRNEKRFDQYDLNIQLPEPLVPRPLRLGLKERTLADGSVLHRPQDADIKAICTNLVEKEIEAVAIGFLHSYRNNTNEQYVASQISKQLGNSITICQSADVAGEVREFERFSTVCANAYVRPLMTRYIERLENELMQQNFAGAFLMMLSDGSLTTTDQAKRFPIRLVEGGPAGGVALGAHVAKQLQSRKTLSLDIGGTTAKICFIEDGRAQTTRRFEVARSWRDTKGSGLPINVPTVEMVEIGAGGGSIASVDSMGRLKSGPQSAGSEPGPACYNRGGTEPTITDAHMVMATIDANEFAEGKIALTPEHARDALAKKIQDELNFSSVAEAAAGVVELANETMANAARVHAIELGLDVSDFDLLVSGGGGGLHAARIAEKLGIKRIIVPADAGVGSAIGFLRSPVAFETAISVLENLTSIDHAKLYQRIEDALAYVQKVVSRAVDIDDIATSITAEMRYFGQGLELRTVVDGKPELKEALCTARLAFQDQYCAITGFVLDDVDIELVSLSVKAYDENEAIASSNKQIKTKCSISAQIDKVKTREVYDPRTKTFRKTPAVPRAKLAEATIPGPVIISESQTTTVIPNSWCVSQSAQGHLILEKRR